MKISIIGSGAWGTALAAVFAGAGRDVTLYARDHGLAADINRAHENNIYLPGIRIPASIRATGDLDAAVVAADMLVIATPAQYARDAFQKIHALSRPAVPVISAAKGIEISTGKLLSEVAAEILPEHPYAVLSGPTFAHEAARGLPTAATLATTRDEKTAMQWAEALRAAAFRPYLSRDVTGVEISGALKNVVAIACGIVEGMQLGQNARAAVMTRGIAEMRRYGVARGADGDTFLGLCGIGDLTLTCNSASSRNFSLGLALGQGKSLTDAMAGRRTVAEGAATARAVHADAARRQIDMPIAAAVHDVLEGTASVQDIVRGLLSRDLKPEMA